MLGDTVFAVGAVAWVWFAIQLMITKGEKMAQPASDDAPIVGTEEPAIAI